MVAKVASEVYIGNSGTYTKLLIYLQRPREPASVRQQRENPFLFRKRSPQRASAKKVKKYKMQIYVIFPAEQVDAYDKPSDIRPEGFLERERA